MSPDLRPVPLALREITLQNVLSFGDAPVRLPLGPLNVLIGPNASGKSNLLEAVSLLRSTPAASDTFRRLFSRGGGSVQDWIWKGAPSAPAFVETRFHYPTTGHDLRHAFAFYGDEGGFRVADERIEEAEKKPRQKQYYFYYAYQDGQPAVNVAGEKRSLKRETVELDRSILSQRRDPELYPELTYLATFYESIRLYREWSFGRATVFRTPQPADLRNDVLEEDCSNLGLVLNRLRRVSSAQSAIVDGMKDLYDGFSDFHVVIQGGTVQVMVYEGDFEIPATRLSDGTLRYLCLLAILCDPTPPPLVCIEEPELGLHPDVIPSLARLLVAASERTQVIVTTHSAALVDAMSETPEAVIVCEKHGGQTTMERLDAEALSVWLDQYRLGDLWASGEIGGTRW